jgi:hypothetical protein
MKPGALVSQFFSIGAAALRAAGARSLLRSEETKARELLLFSEFEPS